MTCFRPFDTVMQETENYMDFSLPGSNEMILWVEQEKKKNSFFIEITLELVLDCGGVDKPQSSHTRTAPHASTAPPMFSTDLLWPTHHSLKLRS